jgi:nitrite reductase/ring-hydroxylating ferredoxin subunit/uncharacterized membrane protein
MRSRAHFKGHPIHPMLIPFPFAYLAGAAAFNLAGRLAGRPRWWTVGGYLNGAGLVTALAAAVPGAIDYLTVVPPRSSGKRRATQHLLANVAALGLFAAGRAARGSTVARPPVPAILAELAGLGLLSVGGWLGGTLVYRNQIGVDIRYAGAGKWKESDLGMVPAGEPVTVAAADELEINQMKLLHLNGERIVLARTEDGYAAFTDRCTHRGGSLAGGALICGTVQCPWHGSQFDVRTGAVQHGPADQPIMVYRIEQEGQDIRLVL